MKKSLPPTRRLVLDANVVVSAALGHASAYAAFRHAIQYMQIVASPAIIAEYSEVICRPKFDRYASIAERAAPIRELLRLPTLDHPAV